MKRAHVVFALILALAAPAVTAQEVDLSQAWVKEKQGIKILHLAGTPYEMGVQQGTLLREQVREMMESIWLGPIKQLIGNNMPLARQLVARIAAMCPQYIIEEMRGIAKGAGLPEDDVIFATLIADQM